MAGGVRLGPWASIGRWSELAGKSVLEPRRSKPRASEVYGAGPG